MTKILRFPSFLFASACFLQFDFTNAACLLANRCKSRRTQTKTVARFRSLRRHHPVQQLMLSPQSVRERDDSTSAVASRDSHCPRIIHGQSMIAFSLSGSGSCKPCGKARGGRRSAPERVEGTVVSDSG